MQELIYSWYNLLLPSVCFTTVLSYLVYQRGSTLLQFRGHAWPSTPIHILPTPDRAPVSLLLFIHSAHYFEGLSLYRFNRCTLATPLDILTPTVSIPQRRTKSSFHHVLERSKNRDSRHDIMSVLRGCALAVGPGRQNPDEVGSRGANEIR